MRKMRSFLALMLVFSIIFSALPVAGAMKNFEKTGTWSDDLFTDVPKDQWYYETVKAAVELSLMVGSTDGTFSPEGLVTLAETVTVASRIHAIAKTGEENFEQGTPWYGVYVDYALENGILSAELSDYEWPATREEFARILSKALPEEDLVQINTVDDGMIPDVKEDEAVYLLYRAGVLTGNDEKGTFAPNSNIMRSEVAAIVARMALPELRKKIELTAEEGDRDIFVPSGSRPNDKKPVSGEEERPVEDEPAASTEGVSFDQQYPDLIANGSVDFSGEQVNLKLKEAPTGAVQQQLYDAGVTKLEFLYGTNDGNWYVAYTTGDVTQVLEAVRQVSAVLTAEYDYVYSTQAFIDKETEKDPDVLGNGKHQEQWYLDACGLKKGWGHLKHHHHHGPKPDDKDKGDANVGIAGENVVVAVIDTGVDYTHPDLVDNIWKNTNEIPDDGKDNDGNGYIDDYYGVDITTGKGSGKDDNGHGTHVAGIVAGSNNNTGIVGIAYNAKIMNIKAGQASGYFNNSDIAKAITYAANHGAHVINMSFGGIASSQAVEEALANAFTNCILVAAAGNDGEPNEENTVNKEPKPSYPAAYPYVLGVMSVDQNGVESNFSNWDVKAFNSVEYELYAPGYQMLSTIPDGKYAAWSGTSMAAPVVSGMAALLRANFWNTDTYPTRFIYGQLSGTGTQAECYDSADHGKHNIPKIVDVYEALTVLPQPEVSVSDYMIFDTVGLKQDAAGKNNGDGVIDAGETIALGFTLRNHWGKSGETTVTVDAKTQGGVDQRVTILNDTVSYGSIGTYSTGDAGFVKEGDRIVGLEHPIYVQVAQDCPNDAIVTLNVTVTSTNGLDETDKETYVCEETVKLDVRNAVILQNKFEEDTVLEGGKLYVIPNSTTIFEGATVTVEPGARIQFWSDDEHDAYAQDAIAYLKVEGTLLLQGTKEQPIEIFPGENFSTYRVAIYTSGSGSIKMYHTKVTNPWLTITYAEDCEFTQNYRSERYYYRSLSGGKVQTSSCTAQITADLVKDCVFDRLGGDKDPGLGYWYTGPVGTVSGRYDGCVFTDCALEHKGNYENCLFYGNNTYQHADKGNVSSLSLDGSNFGFGISNIVTNEETGTTYVIDRTAKITPDLLGVLSSFAESLGGTLLCINDEAELEFLQNYLQGECLVGLQKDPETGAVMWEDGTAYEGFPTAGKEAEWNFATYYSAYKKISLYNYTSKDATVVLELPGQIINQEHLYLDTNEEGVQIETALEPVLAKDALQYRSKDETVAKVSDTGFVTPVSAGETVIVIASSDGVISTELPVTVRQHIAMEAVELGEDVQLAAGETYRLQPVLTPADATEKLVYLSGNDAVARVTEDGVIEAVAPGTAEITAYCAANDQVKDTVTVTVVIPATGVEAKEELYVTDLQSEETVEELGIVLIPEDTTFRTLNWESSNPEILEVDEDGNLVKHAEGTAVLRATLDGTEHYADVIVVLSETVADASVVQMGETSWTRGSSYDDNMIALFRDGTMWWWGDNMPSPEPLPFQNIQKFANRDNLLVLVDREGVMNIYEYNRNTAEWVLNNYPIYGEPVHGVVEVASNGSSVAYTLENGEVWAWGENSSGQLGVGNTTDQSRALQVQVKTKITNISFDDYHVMLLLDETGDLYYCGSPNSGHSVSVPTFYASGVLGISDTGAPVIEYETDVQYDLFGSRKEKQGQHTWNKIYGSYWYLNNGRVFGTGKNGYGQLGVGTASDVSQYTQMKNITNAENLFVMRSSTVFVTTGDNKLYGVGYNDASGTYIPGYVGSQTTPVRIYLGMKNQKITPTLEKTDLAQDWLELDFDQGLKSGSQYGSILLRNGSGVTLSMEKEVRLDKLRVRPYAGFEDGETYTLTVPAGALQSYFATKTEAITVTVTYEQEEAATLTLRRTVTAAEQTEEGTEPVRFAWTKEMIKQKWEAFRKNGESKRFRGNALINRTDLVVDSNVERWLRIAGASSSSYAIHPIGGNYWGTDDRTMVNHQILDYDDYQSLVDLGEGDYLTQAPETVWPFVTKVWLTNKDGETVTSVGNETLTVHVTFNRDMDSSVALNVRYGSDYPYGDYVVEGSYVDARTWEGTMTLQTFVAGGYQCFSIRSGRAADDHDKELILDWGRFPFKIDTTGALAMTMQASVERTGINLSWYQDDFDTLAGYHVYRSENGENGLYTRINPTIIPVGTTEFFDDNVQPAKEYWYVFKVVKTDLSESNPSNKACVVSMDTMPPSLTHTAVGYATQNSRLTITANVTDNMKLDSVKLHFRVAGTEAWTVREMTALNSKYSAVMEGYELNLAGMEYYISADDGVSITCKGSAEAPYQITVREASDVAGLGDVNGDGAITLLDAYRVLQAANGQVIITDPEEFKRGDLNSDGKFSASEALRIVMYINGDVGSLKMDV